MQLAQKGRLSRRDGVAVIILFIVSKILVDFYVNIPYRMLSCVFLSVKATVYLRADIASKNVIIVQ